MPLRILLVEHDDDVRSAYRRYFERQGHAIYGAKNVEQCVDQTQRLAPDAIVLEPEFFDDDAIAQLASRLEDRSIPLVVVTRMRAIPHIKRALPVAACFFKPVSMRRLETTIADAVASVGKLVSAGG